MFDNLEDVLESYFVAGLDLLDKAEEALNECLLNVLRLRYRLNQELFGVPWQVKHDPK